MKWAVDSNTLAASDCHKAAERLFRLNILRFIFEMETPF